MGATYHYNIHTPKSKNKADEYFKVGTWYYSYLSEIIAQYSCTEHNTGVWIGAGGTVDYGIRMLSVEEWIPASEPQIIYAKNVLSKNK